MSHKMLQEMRDIYVNGVHDADLIEEEIVTTISYGMFYEGKTAQEVLDFLADAEGEEIIEKYEEILDTIEKENITESTVFSEEVEFFVEEQAQQLDEFVGAALRVAGAAAKGLKFAKGAKGLAPLARLKGAGGAAKTAISRISKQGLRKSSVVRKALEPVTSKIKAGAAAVRAQASKLPAPVKGFIKTTGKVLKNIGIPVAAAGAGYLLGKKQGESEAGGGGTPAPAAEPKPSYPGGQTKAEGEAVNKKYQELRTKAVDPKGKIKDPEAVKKAEEYGKAQWAKLYPNLAAKVKPDGTQKGTGQSQMEKDAEELRSMQKSSQERQEADKKKLKKEAYEVVLDYLLSEGHADTVEEAHYVMMQMDAEYIQSIVEGFPATGPVRVDPAQKLRLQQDPSGRKYYTGPGGREMSPEDVNKVMRGDLMVKGGKKKPTTQVAHYEPEGEVIGEGDPSFQIKKSSGIRALSADAAKQLGPKAEGLRKGEMGKVGLPKLKEV